jgi:hypothetical protein
VKADRGWNRPFDDPIPLPRGRQLVTLQDAGTYITKLPEPEHAAAAWQAAMEALILVATLGGPTMFARIARGVDRSWRIRCAGFFICHHPARAPRLQRNPLTSRAARACCGAEA